MERAYLDIVDRYFWDKEVPEAQSYTDWYGYSQYFKPDYIRVYKEKEDSMDQWNSLLAEINGLDWVRGKIRDMFYDGNNILKAVIRIKSNKASDVIGIIFHLSFVDNQIGFYFSDISVLDSPHPIREATTSGTGDSTSVRVHFKTSFFGFRYKKSPISSSI